MAITGVLYIFSLVFAAWFTLQRIKINFTLSSVGLALMLAFHGPAYWLYTRYWIHGNTYFNKLYDRSTERVLEPGATAYDHLARLSGDPAFNVALAHLDISMTLLFIGMIVGIVMVDWVCASDQLKMKSAIISWQKSPLTSCLPRRSSKTFFWSLMAVFSIALIVLYLQTDKFEIVYRYFFTTGSEIEKIAWRRANGGFPYFWNLFFSTIAIFATVYAMSELRFSKLVGPFIAIVFTGLIIFGKMAYLSKAPVVVYALQICVAVLIARSLDIGRSAVITLVAVAVFGALAMVFVANSGMHGITNALIFLFYRVFMIPNESLVEYFLAFPNYLPHTNGLDNRFIAFALGEPKIVESYWRVAEVLRGVGGSTTTAMFIGDSWAEFGWWGVLLFPLAFGALLRFLDIVLVVKLGKTPASIAGLSLGYYGIFTALSTSLFTALLTGGIIMIPPLVVITGLAPAWRTARKT